MAEALDSLPPALAKLVGTTIAGAYRLDGVLGAGNMGVVFEGVQLKLKRPVAVKILDPAIADSERSARRFQREAESVARLDHINCLQVYDFGTTPTNLHYMVMPRLEGRPLDKLVGDGTLAPRRALELTAQVLAGLAHAHGQGLIHRDLKPSNILVEEHGDLTGAGDVVKIVDFGIAKIVDDEASFQTRTGMLFGTPAYMSPEQALGEPIDGRSDLYSAGLVLYRLLAGDVPHRARSLVDQMRRRVTLPVPDLPAPCPPPVVEIIHRLCALSVDERYADATTARDVVLGALRDASASSPMWDLAMEPLGDQSDEDAGTLVDDERTETDEAANDDASTVDGVGSVLGPEDTWTTNAPLSPVARVAAEVDKASEDGRATRRGHESSGGETPVPQPEAVEIEETAGRPLRGIVRAAVVGAVLGCLALLWVAWGPTGQVDELRSVDAASVSAAESDPPEVEVELDPSSSEPNLATEVAAPSADEQTASSLEALGRVNVRQVAETLTVADRHALLDLLREDPSTKPLVDEVLNAVLDLKQAHESDEPCVCFEAALIVLEGVREPEVRRVLRAARAPAGDDAACARARARLQAMRAGTRGGSRPVGGPEPGQDSTDDADTSSTARGEITPKLGGLR